MEKRVSPLIVLKGEPATSRISFFDDHTNPYKTSIRFTNRHQTYSYSHENVLILRKYLEVDPKTHAFFVKGKPMPAKQAWFFSCKEAGYWRFLPSWATDGSTCLEYGYHDVTVLESCFTDKKSSSIFDYLKTVVENNALHGNTDNPFEDKSILAAQYEKIPFVNRHSLLASYLNPERSPLAGCSWSGTLIFPFSSNRSQVQAVQEAFSHQVSIIEGPPGTGKTQTILTLLANILLQGKTAFVVSSNNTAIANIRNKLQSANLGFTEAFLGNRDNTDKFLSGQKGKDDYPKEMESWRTAPVNDAQFLATIKQEQESLLQTYTLQERQAKALSEQQALRLEEDHYYKELGEPAHPCNQQAKVSSPEIATLLRDLQFFAKRFQETSGWVGMLARKWNWTFHLKPRLKPFFDRPVRKAFSLQDMGDVIHSLHFLWYYRRQVELAATLDEIQQKLQETDGENVGRCLSEHSMLLLRHTLAERYLTHGERDLFDSRDLKARSGNFLKEYPIVLSTTFSALNALNSNCVFDYVIMDEASQVSVETGVLAILRGRNLVVVGDSKQLPHVVGDDDQLKIGKINERFQIPKAYDCLHNSFLESILQVFPQAPRTLLKEHYRSDPAIIGFCNKQFYRNQLIVMHRPQEMQKPLEVITTSGSHLQRGRTNPREVDVITQEVLPSLKGVDSSSIGIIAPYRAQVRILREAIPDERIEISTVHKFQGREKDIIILSTTGNTEHGEQEASFIDDPKLLNVAVSRARKKLILVCGEPEKMPKNIRSLITYIAYQSGTVTKSSIHSVFDLLYDDATEERIKLLGTQGNVSDYDSENLVYNLITQTLQESPDWKNRRVKCFYPMRELIKDTSRLTDEQKNYATNPGTHIDFLLVNQISAMPICAIEVDGTTYHRKPAQHHRDQLKDQILDAYGIPLLRLATDGSGEKRRLQEFFTSIQ